jgi:hypothetical protein
MIEGTYNIFDDLINQLKLSTREPVKYIICGGDILQRFEQRIKRKGVIKNMLGKRSIRGKNDNY